MNNQKKECPKSNDIELFVLKKLPSHADYQEIEKHLQSCHECRELLSELRAFYKTYYDEINKPVANSIFRLVGDIEKDNVIIAAIVLKPQIIDGKSGEKHFISEIIFQFFYSWC